MTTVEKKKFFLNVAFLCIVMLIWSTPCHNDYVSFESTETSMNLNHKKSNNISSLKKIVLLDYSSFFSDKKTSNNLVIRI